MYTLFTCCRVIMSFADLWSVGRYNLEEKFDVQRKCVSNMPIIPDPKRSIRSFSCDIHSELKHVTGTHNNAVKLFPLPILCFLLIFLNIIIVFVYIEARKQCLVLPFTGCMVNNFQLIQINSIINKVTHIYLGRGHQ